MERRAVRHVSIIISIRELAGTGHRYARALPCRMFNTINKQIMWIRAGFSGIEPVYGSPLITRPSNTRNC